VQPETRYARLGDERIAYQTLGEGPPDLLLTTGSFSNPDIEWEDPTFVRLSMRLASFCRMIKFDRRGIGMSDPVSLHALPPWESYAEEAVAVMDHAGSKVATVMAVYDAGPIGLLFAATKPERTAGLILANTYARFVYAPDYPFGPPREVADQLIENMGELWGTEAMVWMIAPSRAADERFRRWHARLQRAMTSPGALQVYLRALYDIDARPVLSAIHTPTLVVHRKELPSVSVEHGRYLAEHIEGARLVELDGRDAALIYEGGDLFADLVEEFMTGERRGGRADRVLATVLFTDIVGSTELAGRLGDERWRRILDAHDEVARACVGRFSGQLVKMTGDGIMATFDGPGRAIGCGSALRADLRAIGIEIRVGLHTGEIELRRDDIGGITVHIAARVMGEAAPGEVLVSGTVRDLLSGSDIDLEDRGAHRLKGVAGEWPLFAVARPVGDDDARPHG
jgi:class 3 adenylate cyclase